MRVDPSSPKRPSPKGFRPGPENRRLVPGGLFSGLALLHFLVLSLLLPDPAGGDGGTLRVGNHPMGAYRINVYTDPTPVPPDTIDISILATYDRGRGVAQGLEIVVEARPLDFQGPTVTWKATRDQADDPRFYAAKFALGRIGLWEVLVRVRGPEGEGEVSFQLKAQEPGVFQNPYLILVLALAPLLLVGWWLRSSQGQPPGS